MRLAFFWIDAFTDRVFAGNPAGVVPVAAWPDDALLQRIAAQNGLAETAFFGREGDGWRLRWFTPTVEMDLCGHATLATAFVLSEFLGERGQTLKFKTRSGDLYVAPAGDGWLELDLPARPAVPIEAPHALEAALGAAPREVRAARDLLCVFDTAQEVRALRPDFARVAAIDVHAVIVTAPGAGEDCDFVSRFFAPRVGVPEDPVTGSAHCTLVPYWAERLGRPRLHARQVSARGGELRCLHDGDRVRLAGQAVCYLKGEIAV